MSSTGRTPSGPRTCSLLLALIAGMLCGGSTLEAQAALGTAQPFAVLGTSTVTNTGPTTIAGDVGVYPGTAVTGKSTITLTGTYHEGDAVARQAEIDARAAYSTYAAMPGSPLGAELGGSVLTPGVYSFASSAQITGSLFLNFLGNPDALFVFKIPSTLTTASGSSVLGLADLFGPNVFWLVGSSATLGTTTAFRGTVLAQASVTLNTGATISCGRAVAMEGAVTMDSNVISTVCAQAVPGTTVPEPSTLALLLGPSTLGLIGYRRRRQAA
jgi:hypothetical protein